MTVQDTRERDPNTPVEIQKIPWSQLGPEFALIWGRADPADPQPEDMEIIGMKGSGKTLFLMKILQERMLVRNSRIILVVTKKSDGVFDKLGWPVVNNYRDIRKYRQCIYWPKTNKLGEARKQFHEQRIRELLEREWRENNWTVIAFDEIKYVEDLSPEVRALVAMYWREARSLGITIVAMKQRPQGVLRDMHSETPWTVAFVPADEADKERFAELFGRKQVWMPVFDQMDASRHEFLIKHTKSQVAYISWVDVMPEPIEPNRAQPA